MSSAAVAAVAVVAATIADADAEFLAGAEVAAEAASLYDDGFDLLIVTGAQS